MKIEYTIGEIAKLYHMSTDTLRYYEKEGLLIPKRSRNGYRVYTLFDSWKLNVISMMKRLGVSLAEIKAFLDQRSVEREKELLVEEAAYLSEQMADLRQQLEHIDQRLQVLDDAVDPSKLDCVHYVTYPKRKMIYIEQAISSDDEVDMAYSQLMHQNGGEWAVYNRDFAMILPLERLMKRAYNDYSQAVLLLPDEQIVYDGELSEGDYAVIRVKGPYTKVGEAYVHLLDRIRRDGKRVVSNALERYMVDVNHTSDPEEYVTELQVRVE